MASRLFVIAAAFIALCACATEGNWAPVESRDIRSGRTTVVLLVGLQHYEDGRYGEAVKSLHRALDQGLPLTDRATAHKYLAFIYCSSNRQSECREQFRKAIAADPSMRLDRAEEGHPMWGPVFRVMRNGRVQYAAP